MFKLPQSTETLIAHLCRDLCPYCSESCIWFRSCKSHNRHLLLRYLGLVFPFKPPVIKVTLAPHVPYGCFAAHCYDTICVFWSSKSIVRWECRITVVSWSSTSGDTSLQSRLLQQAETHNPGANECHNCWGLWTQFFIQYKPIPEQQNLGCNRTSKERKCSIACLSVTFNHIPTTIIKK